MSGTAEGESAGHCDCNRFDQMVKPHFNYSYDFERGTSARNITDGRDDFRDRANFNQLM
jgi:hypothetical protein